jgi:hypothetical protein
MRVYAIKDVEGAIRYIGATRMLLSERLHNHKQRRLRGVAHTIVLLSEEKTSEDARQVEAAYIRNLRAALLNCSEDGGPGVQFQTAETRKKISEAVAGTNHPGARLTPYDVQNIRRSTLPRWKLAAFYGLSGQQIYRIKTGQQWRTVYDKA